MSILILLLLAQPGMATNKVGNGGNVVECKPSTKGAKSSVRLLDFYEHAVSPGNESEIPEEIAEKALARLEKASAPLANQYRGRLKELRAEMELKAGVKLTSIDDSNHLFRPSDKKCKVRQIAIRRPAPTGEEKRFLVSKDLWEKLDAANQAGLLLHEVIYEHFSRLGEDNSAKARKINAMLFSEKFDGAGFWATIKEMRLSIYPQ